MYSLNELNNGYLTTIQLVIILGNLFYRKTFTDPYVMPSVAVQAPHDLSLPP